MCRCATVIILFKTCVGKVYGTIRVPARVFILQRGGSMAKHKTNCTLSPWLSARADNKEKRFIQIGDTLLYSKAFQELSTGARALYLCMAMEAAGRIEFMLTLSTAKKLGFSQASFRRYVAELAEKGFISINSGRTTREPNIYRFILRWKLEDAPK